jgi:hypothetical protein
VSKTAAKELAPKGINVNVNRPCHGPDRHDQVHAPGHARTAGANAVFYRVFVSSQKGLYFFIAGIGSTKCKD